MWRLALRSRPPPSHGCLSKRVPACSWQTGRPAAALAASFPPLCRAWEGCRHRDGSGEGCRCCQPAVFVRVPAACGVMFAVRPTHGADPNLRDWAGFNPAWWAKEYRHQEVLEVYAAEQVAPSGITARMAMEHAGPRARSVLMGAKGARKKKGARSARSASASARK
mmetsp:Transcript_179780/g.570205  ORF Transcript_179780/g.570205 Transcript_179780/m.570205 type:complete len:166 (-) Transcript_179780:107-604(-)